MGQQLEAVESAKRQLRSEAESLEQRVAHKLGPEDARSLVKAVSDGPLR